jgi:hypothetical protein
MIPIRGVNSKQARKSSGSSRNVIGSHTPLTKEEEARALASKPLAPVPKAERKAEGILDQTLRPIECVIALLKKGLRRTFH